MIARLLSVRYQVARATEGADRWRDPTSYPTARDQLVNLAERIGRPWRLVVGKGGPLGPAKPLARIMRRVDAITGAGEDFAAGDELAIACGDAAIRVRLRAVQIAERIADEPDTTASIDRLRAKVWAEFGDRYGVYSLGTSVCKCEGFVSQHAFYPANAIDVGCASGGSDAELVRRLLEVAAFAVATGDCSQVIVRDKIWTPAAGWHPYTGRFHASHVHCSGVPLLTAADGWCCAA